MILYLSPPVPHHGRSPWGIQWRSREPDQDPEASDKDPTKGAERHNERPASSSLQKEVGGRRQAHQAPPRTTRRPRQNRPECQDGKGPSERTRLPDQEDRKGSGPDKNQDYHRQDEPAEDPQRTKATVQLREQAGSRHEEVQHGCRRELQSATGNRSSVEGKVRLQRLIIILILYAIPVLEPTLIRCGRS